MHRDPLGVDAVEFVAEYVPVASGARLRLLRWHTSQARGRPILFVPGWVSALEGWIDLLRALVLRHPLFYLETREKGSAELDRIAVHEFRVDGMATDLRAAVAATGLDVSEAIVVGSSLGASVLLEAMKHDRLRPRAAFLIGPTCHFRFPWWGHAILQLPAWGYAVVKHFVLWYLRTFRVDAGREPEQMRRYEQTLKLAHPRRLKASARAVAGFSIWPDLETISTPVAVAYAGTDTLHAAPEIERLFRMLARPTAIACPSNRYMHSAALTADLNRFLSTLD